MNEDSKEDTKTYMVIKNYNAEYSLWLTNRKIPFGWRDTYKRGTREECLTYITRMRVTLIRC